MRHPALIKSEPKMTGRVVLIVEDNQVQGKVISLLAKKHGFEVVVVRSGKEALDELAVDERIAMVLMDWMMADMDGLECTRRIRKRELKSGNARVPIVAMTAQSAPGDREKCLEAGMDDYLSKPFSGQDFLLVLNRWTGGNLVEGETQPESSRDDRVQERK